MGDTELQFKRRVFLFNEDTRFHAFIHRDGDGRFRWSVRDTALKEHSTVSLSTIGGWETEEGAIDACRDYHEALGVKLKAV